MSAVYHEEIVRGSGQIIYFSTFPGKFGRNRPCAENRARLPAQGDEVYTVNAARQEPTKMQATATGKSLRHSRSPSAKFFAARAPEKIPQKMQIVARRIPTGTRSGP